MGQYLPQGYELWVGTFARLTKADLERLTEAELKELRSTEALDQIVRVTQVVGWALDDNLYPHPITVHGSVRRGLVETVFGTDPQSVRKFIVTKFLEHIDELTTS